MKWEDTDASKCRYGDVIGELFENADIVWEDSYDDYQGHAEVVAVFPFPSSDVVHYRWEYGSCSGCDGWEAEGASDAQIREEVKRTWAKFSSFSVATKYLFGLRSEGLHSAWARFLKNRGMLGIITPKLSEHLAVVADLAEEQGNDHIAAILRGFQGTE